MAVEEGGGGSIQDPGPGSTRPFEGVWALSQSDGGGLWRAVSSEVADSRVQNLSLCGVIMDCGSRTEQGPVRELQQPSS